MTEEQDIELIELYIQHKLEKPAQESVETRLKTDVAFAQLFRDIKILMEGVTAASREELTNELKTFETELSGAENGKTISFPKQYWPIAIAASIAFVAALIFWLKEENQPAKNLLFSEYYKPYPNVIMLSQRGENEEADKVSGFQKYDQGEYAAAANQFEKLDTKDFSIFFYLGSCYLATKEIDKAILNFGKCLETDNRLNGQAEWYLALCYLYKNDIDKCIRTLEKVIQRGSPYSKSATELLTKIKNPSVE